MCRPIRNGPGARAAVPSALKGTEDAPAHLDETQKD
jgi:hypothetical protein